VDGRSHDNEKKIPRTLNNEEQRENRKNQYIEGKKKYQAAIRTEKLNSWKQYCNTTSPSNPWTVAYKLATEKKYIHTYLHTYIHTYTHTHTHTHTHTQSSVSISVIIDIWDFDLS